MNNRGVFVLRIITALHRTGAAEVMGAPACWMLVAIARKQDEMGRSPVPVRLDELRSMLGYAGNKDAIRIRDAAVAEGWLNLKRPPKGSRQPGQYEVTVPEDAGHFVTSSQIGTRTSSREGTRETTSSSLTSSLTSSLQGTSSFISLYPDPNSCPIDDRPSDRKQASRSADAFKEFYAAYPRKVKPQVAEKAYGKAVKAIAKRCESGEQAHAFLLDRARAFAESAAGQAGQYTPHPSSWLNAGSYDDDPREWNRDGGKPHQQPTPPFKRAERMRSLAECGIGTGGAK